MGVDVSLDLHAYETHLVFLFNPFSGKGRRCMPLAIIYCARLQCKLIGQNLS
jgi:hypothetical protein